MQVKKEKTMSGVGIRKELLWALSVSTGILMCKIVDEITSALSSSCFKVYDKLDGKTKLEWNNRAFSTVHAIAVAVSCLYLFLFSDTFADAQGGSIVDRSSAISNMIMGVSVGYFLSDLGLILYHFPSLGGIEYIIHHGLSLFSILLSLLSGQAHFYIIMVLFTEVTTPFVNLRWYLDVAGMKNSRIYIYNGLALFFGWLVARIFLFVFYTYHMYYHFDEAKKVFALGFYSLIGVPPLLATMNMLWFWKITKGMLKTLNKARHHHTQ